MLYVATVIAQPRAMFGGEFLHKDLFEMAAAYLFHIVLNHPFLDGNKRTGTVAALVFLDLNGIEIDAPKGSLYDLTMSVATGQTDKAQIAEYFRSVLDYMRLRLNYSPSVIPTSYVAPHCSDDSWIAKPRS